MSNILFITLFYASITSFSFANDSIQLKKTSHVENIFQDNKGFVWFAGQQGLTRFDGERSITFSSQSSNYPLPFNWINDCEQIDDTLILATEIYGLYSLNTKSGQSHPIFTDSGVNTIYHVSIFNNNYYFERGGKIYEYQAKTENTRLIASDMDVNEISHTDSHLYVSSNSGLYRLTNNFLVKILDHPIIETTAINDTIIAITKNKIFSINDDGLRYSISIDDSIDVATKVFNQDSFFTVNTKGGINKYSSHDLSKIRHGYENINTNRVKTLLHDSSGILWLATDQSVKRLHEKTITEHLKKFSIITNANEIALLNNDIIIGSYGAGLQNLFKDVFNDEVNLDFTSKAQRITSLTVVNHSLFIATFDGVWLFDQKLNNVSKLAFEDNNKIILKIKYKDNKLYIATDGNGLYAYDLKNQRVIWNITSDNGLSSNEIIDILPLENGNVWLATAKGIDIYDTKTSKIENIKIPDGNKIVSLAVANHKIFAASLGNGIFAFNHHGHLLGHMGQGISFSGLLVHENEIWASARPGLYRLSTKNHQLGMLENTGEYSFVGSSLVHNNVLYSSYYGGVLELDLTKKPKFNPTVIISKTTVSGTSYLLNKTIEVSSSNDLITLDLASLDYRPGLAKKYQYKINSNPWQSISGSQLTLTGLASGDYNIEIMATNSLGQWSDLKAYTEINVAYPWYWTAQLKVIYAVLLLFIGLLTGWLLYLRTKSINHIHNLLKDDMRNYGRLMKTTERNLALSLTSIDNNEIEQSRALIEKSWVALKEATKAQEPDNLSGSNLATAIPFLANYIDNKYDVKLHVTLDDKVDSLNYELKADIYKVIFEALISSIFKNSSIMFDLTLQEVKEKVWLTIDSDNNSFSNFDSKVNFDIASYTIRQITNKHQASLNTFDNDDGSSQLVISFPLMQLN